MLKRSWLLIMLVALEVSCGRTPKPAPDPRFTISGNIEFLGEMENRASRCMLVISAKSNSDVPFEFSFLDVQYYLGSSHVWTMRVYRNEQGTTMVRRESAENGMPSLAAIPTTLTKQNSFSVTDILIDKYCSASNRNDVGATASFVTVDGKSTSQMPVELAVR